jgi:membrane protease YdiL (CAAX protease family)
MVTPQQWRDPPGKNDPDARREPLTRWLWAVVPAMFMPLTGAIIYWVVLSDFPRASQTTYGAIKFLALLWPVLAWVILLRRRLPLERLFAWQDHLRAVPLGLLTGVIISLGILAFRYFPPFLEPLQSGGAGIEEKMQQLGVLQYFWAFAVVLSLFHSLLEEYYWRGFVFGLLDERLDQWQANLLAAAAFSSHHFVILWAFFPPWLALLTGVGVFLGGVIWSWQYHFQGRRSLAGIWVSHALVDFTLMVIGWQLLQG